MKKILLTSWCAAGLLGVHGSNDHGISWKDSSDVSFTYPESLVTKDHPLLHRSALFGGGLSAGHPLIGTVYIEQEIKSEDHLSSCPTNSDPVKDVRVDRGDVIMVVDGWSKCTFVQLADQAQNRGASGMLLVEDKCLASRKDDLSFPSSFRSHCDKVGYIPDISYMGGVDSKITIPSMIITRWDGLRLIECAKQMKDPNWSDAVTGVDCTKDQSKSKSPIVSMRWAIPQENAVGWELWTTSLLNADLFVLDYFAKSVAPKLIDSGKTKFAVRYFVWDGKALGCTTYQDCGDACHNNGRYCHFDPDGIDKGNYTGMTLSQENLRQFCLYEQCKNDQEKQKKWWLYVNCIANNCSGKTDKQSLHSYSEECSKSCHTEAGLGDVYDQTLKCINDSGGYDAKATTENKYWESELDMRSRLDIKQLPTVIINGVVVDFGTKKLSNVLNALCAGLKLDSRPDFCTCVDQNPGLSEDYLAAACFGYDNGKNGGDNGGGNNNNNSSGGESSGGVTFGTVFWLLFFVVGGLIGGFVVMRSRDRRRMRSEFHEDIRNIMGEYMRMDQDESSSGSFIGDRLVPSGGGGGNRGGREYNQVELS